MGNVTWKAWSSVSEGSSMPGAPVAAVPWGQSFALFIADPGGGVYAIKAEPGFGWELVSGRSTKPGAQVTAVPWNNRFQLFMADVNGQIYKTSGIPYQGWDPWTSVSEGSSTPGAPVAAVPWLQSLALFIADPGGGIYAIKAEPGFGWELVPGRCTTPGAHVTAVPHYTDGIVLQRITLFMADVNGQIYTTSGMPYQGWDPWTSVSEGSSTPGAPLAAAAIPEEQGLYLLSPIPAAGFTRSRPNQALGGNWCRDTAVSLALSLRQYRGTNPQAEKDASAFLCPMSMAKSTRPQVSLIKVGIPGRACRKDLVRPVRRLRLCRNQWMGGLYPTAVLPFL
jgi:hypothetical protein